MFSAIAMVAFMGSSMANTIEVEKVAEEGAEMFKLSSTCDKVAALSYNLEVSEGATHAQAVAASNTAYNNCMKSQ